MFYRYEIKKHGGRDVLYLYMSMGEEESNEFVNRDNVSIEERIKRFINQNNINYSNGPVYLVMNGIVVKSMDISNRKVNVETLDEEIPYTNNKFIVRVKNEYETISMKLSDYLLGLMLTNVNYDFDVEVLKSVAILYRTYAYKQMGKIGYIEIDDHFAKFRNISYYKLLWFKDYDKISKNMLRAINETECMFIKYNNIFIKPYIHNTNNGNTDVLPNVEYLVKVPSLWDLTSSMYLNITRYTVEKVAQLLNLDKDDLFGIKILELTEGGCINKVKVGYTIFDGEEFRQNLNLPSKDMTILIDDKYITFVNRGHGDNLGLSLNGSAELAKAGCNYLQILNYYFPTCKIKKYI